MDWRSHLIDDDAGIRRILGETRRVAVLGIKIEPGQPANYVPAYAQRIGLEIVPVPVYYPDATEILGEPVYRRVAEIPGDVDLVNVFRAPQHVPAHAGEGRPQVARTWYRRALALNPLDVGLRELAGRPS